MLSFFKNVCILFEAEENTLKRCRLRNPLPNKLVDRNYLSAQTMLLQGDQRPPLCHNPLAQRRLMKSAGVTIHFPWAHTNLYPSDAVRSCCKNSHLFLRLISKKMKTGRGLKTVFHLGRYGVLIVGSWDASEIRDLGTEHRPPVSRSTTAPR